MIWVRYLYSFAFISLLHSLTFDFICKLTITGRLKENNDFTCFVSMQTRRTPLHFVVSEINGDDGDELMVMLLAHGAKINLADRVCYFYLSC